MTHRKTLVLVRHAKAESDGATDHARELTERGTADAAALGTRLAESGVRPDHALVSSAARARATWVALAAACAPDVEPGLDGAVYTGSGDVVIDALRLSPDDATVVMFVGHNPTVASLAHELEDGKGEAAATQALLEGFPPGAAAVLEVPVAWADLAPESCRLLAFHAPHRR